MRRTVVAVFAVEGGRWDPRHLRPRPVLVAVEASDLRARLLVQYLRDLQGASS